MNTLELTAVMDKVLFNNHFLGVLACDQLPTKVIWNLPTMVIVNTHTSDLPGEHWLAVYISEDRVGCFFDSFGNKPDYGRFPTMIADFLNTSCTTQQYSTRQVQDFTSTTCGQHCVFFLYHMAKGCSYEEVISKYSFNLAKNDNMVSAFVKKLYPCVCKNKLFKCVQHVKTGQMFIV